MKKFYAAPRLTMYGAVADLTRNFTLQNSDTPQGTSNTAFPPGS